MKAVIIADFDGVLCDQREFDFFSFEYVCQRMKLKPTSLKYFVSLRKKGLDVKTLFVKKFKCPGAELSKAVSLRKKWIKKNIDRFIPRPVNHVVDAISNAGRKHKIIIISKRLKSDMPVRFIEKYNLPISKKDIYNVQKFNRLANKKFNENNSVLDVKRTMLDYLKRHYNLKRSKCFYVGDTIDDFKAAESVGIRFCGVLTGYVMKSNFLSYGAEVCKNFSSFLSKFNKKD